jgi:ubiquinone/menaquinone biosynthesis C-methylase UbiE
MGFEVSGMDPSERGINAARELMESEGLSAELDVVEPGQIPVEDGSYEAVLSLYAIEHGARDEVKKSVEELRRVLKRGGLSLVTLSSDEDGLKSTGQLLAPGTYVPNEGPEEGIAHFLATREDIDEFFAELEVLELAHVSSWLSALYSDKHLEAHWIVIARKY